MAKTKTKENETAATTTTSNRNVVTGANANDLKETVIEQAKKARGEDEKKVDDGGSAGAKPSTFPNPDELKFRDESKQARVDHLKTLGIDDPEGQQVASNSRKVEDADTSDKMYSGIVTMTGYSGEYHQKTSQRVDIGATPRGLEWCSYAFRQLCGANCVLESIDEKNETDPLLRTRYE